MPYLIEHRACNCGDYHLSPCATPLEVAMYLWGREVTKHVVWSGECPYQFWEPDTAVIFALLEDCPVELIRPLLPCSFWAGSKLLVVIGSVDVDKCQPVRELSYLGWLLTQKQARIEGGVLGASPGMIVDPGGL